MLIEDNQSEAVRYIFNEYITKKVGIAKLAEIMNTTTYLPPKAVRKPQKSNYWTATTILHILSHPAYMGGPNAKWKYKTPAIITPEIWQAAQSRRKTNMQYKPSDRGKTEYQGRLVCGLCGHKLQIAYNGGHRKMYSCPGRRSANHPDGSAHCTLPRFDATQLDKKIATKIQKMRDNPQLLMEYLEKCQINLQAEKKIIEARIKPLRVEADAIKEEQAILDARVQMKRITPEVYKVHMAELQAKLDLVEARTTNLDPTLLRDVKVMDAYLVYCQGIIEALQKLLETTDGEPIMTDEELAAADGTEKEKREYLQLRKGLLEDNRKIFSQIIGSGLVEDSNFDAFKYFIVFPDKIELKGNISMRKLNSLSVLEKNS